MGLALLLFSGLFKLYYQDRSWSVNHQANHFQEALNNCHAFVTHNSTASVDSCIRGVPTFVTSDLAICWPVANTDLSKIETPEYPDRTQWVNDLGYKMWSIKEIKDGTVYKRFKSKLGL